MTKKREFEMPLAELLDRMTITQIKTVLKAGDTESYTKELKKLRSDIGSAIEESKLSVTAEFLQYVVILSQINLHIWHNKDKMQECIGDEAKYLQLLKHAHQLNGYRNKIKNVLLGLEGKLDISQLRSNFETDGLKLELI